MQIIDFDEDIRIDEYYKLISRNVVKIRKSQKISQLKLANAIGHQSPTFVGKAEILAEGKHFNLEHIFKMAIVLEVDINDFFEGIETTNQIYTK